MYMFVMFDAFWTKNKVDKAIDALEHKQIKNRK